MNCKVPRGMFLTENNVPLTQTSEEILENTQVGKSHWNIKKMSVIGTILYLFFRTQDEKRIYFWISSAMKKAFLAKRANSVSFKKSPITGTSTMSFSKVVCNQKM